MHIETAVINRLLDDAGVSALVGTRIWPGRRQQASPLPAITVHRISGAPVYTNDGETGLEVVRLQIDCWGRTWTSAKDTAAAVKESLSAFAGTESPVTFQNVLLDTEQDHEETGSNAAEYLYRTRQDYLVWWNE